MQKMDKKWNSRLLELLDLSMQHGIRISQGQLPRDDLFSCDLGDVIIAFIKSLIKLEFDSGLEFPDNLILAMTAVINIKQDEFLCFLLEKSMPYLKDPKKMCKDYEKEFGLKI